ncbi:hypothetical protein OV079_00775 [Nannocystis pusilla]|uniref:Uncharacterized protein n=1 Tax=Nannocystis pusilla TaxID=889268 RepID=A0A9X3ITL2_9BACT|nr:hypothetical protein [Nannocystis pusilla]MCY1004122.1 hypothetical protein [Nannocystis pusilla]
MHSLITRGIPFCRLAGAVLGLLAACGDDGRDSASATAGITSVPGPTTAPPATTTTGDATTGTSDDGTGTSTSAGLTTGPTTTDASSTSTGPATTTGAAKFDLGAMPDVGMTECVDCALTIDSQQSGTLAILNQNTFATAELQGEIVYALGNAGPGRFIATADSSLPFNEQSDCPIREWLAGSPDPNPKLFWWGWGDSDGPANWNYPGDSSGIHLPPQYVGNPAQLAADYDIVMYLEGSGQFDGGDQPTDEEMQTLLEYVTVHGGGAYISSEFAGYLKPADYASVNRVLMPLGVEALEVNLNWGDVNGQIEFTCFPAPVG